MWQSDGLHKAVDSKAASSFYHLTDFFKLIICYFYVQIFLYATHMYDEQLGVTEERKSH